MHAPVWHTGCLHILQTSSVSEKQKGTCEGCFINASTHLNVVDQTPQLSHSIPEALLSPPALLSCGEDTAG